MRILLLSMPDNFEHMPLISVRMPNGALTSLAGNLDPHHETAVADLVLVRNSVPGTIRRLMAAHDPDVVGLSIMTFQRHTAMAVIDYLRVLKPSVSIVVGGYDPSLARAVYTDVAEPKVDFVVRGEGEITFRELIRAIESGRGFDHIDGLSYRCGDVFRHNRDRGVSSLDNSEILPPKRTARVLKGYTLTGRQVDVVETSRGCTFDCSFCSIIEMRGRNFYRFDIDRVIADIKDAYDNGARSIFFTDDNITLNVRRFEALCQAIISAGLSSIDYSIQGMTSAFADHGEKLAPLMRKAGFRYVFLGIENVVEKDLEEMKALAKNRRRVDGRRVGNATLQAISHLRANGILVVGGLIVGGPTDTEADIRANLRFARRWVDWPYIQHPVPYPGTPMAEDFDRRGLIANRDVSDYDGTTAVVTCANVSGDDLEFMRWKTERWIKLRHGWSAYRHDPQFWRRQGLPFLANLFRGESIRSLLGLESKRKAFERFCRIRREEKAFVAGALAKATAAARPRDVPSGPAPAAGARSSAPAPPASGRAPSRAGAVAFRGIHWERAIGLGAYHAAALLALFPFFFDWAGVGAFLAGYLLLAPLGINIGYHRLLAHRGLACPKWLERTLAFLGLQSLQFGPAYWVALHRCHHHRTDVAGDPHSPQHGTLWAHVTWITARTHDEGRWPLMEQYAKDLLQDPFYRWLEEGGRWAWLPIVSTCLFFLLPFLAGWATGSSVADSARLGASVLVWGVFLRTVCVWHATWAINSFCHMFGYRSFATADTSRNNWIFGILSHGEGWHNNHHAQARSPRHGLLWWEVDLSWWLIRLLGFLGLARIRAVAPPAAASAVAMPVKT